VTNDKFEQHKKTIFEKFSEINMRISTFDRKEDPNEMIRKHGETMKEHEDRI